MSQSRPPLPTGALLAFMGALGVVVGCFLPAVEPRGYKLYVRDTTLIEMGDGLVFVAGAIAVAILAYRMWTGAGNADRAVLVIGVLGVLGAILETQVMSLESLTLTGERTGEVEQADAAVGVWIVALGSALMAVGGHLLRSFIEATPAAGTPRVPEGWYPDPEDAARLRWWDGERWTGATKAEEQRVALPPSG